MKDYASIANTSGAFPNVVGVNASGGGATDGTPFIKDLIDDLWGFNQALMNAANITPSGSSETSSVSQRLLAIQRIAGHPGEIVPWAGPIATDPDSVDIRLLPCEGQEILITSYQDLVDATYVGDGNNAAAAAAGGAFVKTDGAGNPTTAGTHLLLPDLRGLFIRGLDTPAAVDPDGASRYIGDLQDGDVEDHQHYVNETTTPVARALENEYVYMSSDGAGISNPIDRYVVEVRNTAVDAGSIKAETLTPSKSRDETRPYNSIFKLCIRY